jgi:hypothetical protein
VGAQAVYDPAAGLLLVAGPLWLTFIGATTWVRWEVDSSRSRAEAGP